jgi:hypothetical protein
MKRRAMDGMGGVHKVHRLMGASVCQAPGSVVERLLGMRKDISRFNAARGLRTALLYSGGWLLQWHEGPAASVDEAWVRSQAQPGHGHHRLLHRSAGNAALVGRLHIASLHSREKGNDVVRRLYEVQRRLGRHAEPAQTWQCVSAPCLIDADVTLPVGARCHLVAVTSELSESMDLVKSIAERHHVPVSYQRFADGETRNGDVGAAYVDTASAGRLTRLHAISRRALDDGMVRLSLRSMRCLILLLGDHAPSAARLGEAAKSLLERIADRPAVRLLGTCRDTSKLVAASLADMHGLDVHEIHGGGARARVDTVLRMIAGTGCMVPAQLEPISA